MNLNNWGNRAFYPQRGNTFMVNNPYYTSYTGVNALYSFFYFTANCPNHDFEGLNGLGGLKKHSPAAHS